MSKLRIFIVFLFLMSLRICSSQNTQDKQVYIVYMGALPSYADYMPISHHTSVLQEVTGLGYVESRLVRNYKKSFNGFAARLTESEREKAANLEGVVSVFPNMMYKPQTTMSWDFMGLKEGQGENRNPTTESDTIIGVIDSGIYHESKSFTDKGFSPPPKKWKGACEGGKNFTCNNKLIGARYYITDSAKDDTGHGSHTASTAAGNVVRDVSFYGFGNGTARGGVPAARIAVYKACDVQGCRNDIILSAFDDAIADNVDLITISIGTIIGLPAERDSIAIGAFHAMAKGILTVNAVGNDGPGLRTVTSTAPWIFSVGASNTNRGFVTKVAMRNGKTFVGRSVNSFDLNGTILYIVYGESVSSKCSDDLAKLCLPGCLNKKLVKGKILMCDSAAYWEEAKSMGAVGSIATYKFTDLSYIFSFPVSVLSKEDYNTVVAYFKSTKNPKATILKSDTIFKQTSPVVALFSSRGPNIIFPDILKPDITAPGVDILAAYSPEVSPSESLSDKRRVKYAIDSGTSMSCPHVAGVTAYVKTFHPDWTPSMVQSAIMTTAWPMKYDDQGEFAYGAGHIDPIMAIRPGLVYEASKSDHINFLCGFNYTLKTLTLISGEQVTCNEKPLPRNLNYPSMTAKVVAKKPFEVTFTRTVKNVDISPGSTYKANVLETTLKIKVVPDILSMKTMHEEKSFTITVSGNGIDVDEVVSSHLIWSDGFHFVKSPIVVYAQN
ncbi:unnamed protein product [Cochlearia groenlandica]